MPKVAKKQKDYAVIQSNQFVRYFRHDSTWNMQQQRCYYFLASLIKETDEPDTVYKFKADYMRLSLGMNDSGKNYKDIKDILKYLRDNSQWIRNERGNLEVVSILQSVQIKEDTGDVEIQFHRLIQPHLFNLQTRYTRESLGTLFTFDCKYTPELYLFLLSYFNENHQEERSLTVPLKEIKERLCCQYSRWVDIKRFVIDKAVNEINQYSTCMRVSYEPVKRKKSVEYICFNLRLPDSKDAAFTMTQIKAQEAWKEKHKKGIQTEETRAKRAAAKEKAAKNREKIGKAVEKLEAIEGRLSLNPSFEALTESNRELLEIASEMKKIYQGPGSAAEPPEGSETK